MLAISSAKIADRYFRSSALISADPNQRPRFKL
jgi:hypothetical protein